jgi:hypothetical protein
MSPTRLPVPSGRAPGWRWCLAVLLASVLGALLLVPAGAAAAQGDRTLVGGALMVSDPIGGDLRALGGRVVLATAIDGDAFVAGGNVQVGGELAHDLTVLGGKLTLTGQIGGDARVFGGSVDIAPTGALAGDLFVIGGRVYLDSTVAGNVRVVAGRLELGPSARIGGTLRYHAGSGVVRHPDAVVGPGASDGAPGIADPERSSGSPGDPGAGSAAATSNRESGWFGEWFSAWNLMWVLLAALVAAVAPRLAQRVGADLVDRTGLSLVSGVGVFVIVPALALLFAITIIGIPVALVLAFGYALGLALAYVMGVVGLADRALRRWGGAAAASGPTLGWRVGAAAAAMAVFSALTAMSSWAGLLAFGTMLAGLGAWVLPWIGGRRTRA